MGTGHGRTGRRSAPRSKPVLKPAREEYQVDDTPMDTKVEAAPMNNEGQITNVGDMLLHSVDRLETLAEQIAGAIPREGSGGETASEDSLHGLLLRHVDIVSTSSERINGAINRIGSALESFGLR